MKSILLLAVALLFCCVSAQDEKLLCDVNLLTDSSTNKTFECATNSSLQVENVTIPANEGNDVFEAPANKSLVSEWKKEGLFGNYTGNVTKFFFQIDAGSAVGVGSAAEVNYDFDGDGKWDRNETFDLFTADPVPGFETWNGSATNDSSVSSGNYTNMNNGTIRLLLWSTFGSNPLTLKIGASNDTSTSNISFPFTFFAGNATGGTGGGTGGAACCNEIASIKTELDSLSSRVDILSSRLQNVTQNCCANVNATATATQVATGTQVEVSTAVASATVEATA